MYKPMFSIIIPVYNRAACIRESVESVINQTFDKWELVLVDDGSTDQTGDICDEYVSKDKRVRCIHQKNGGVSSARNAGLKSAAGEYILFLDSDDYFLPEVLAVMREKILMYRQVDMICFGFGTWAPVLRGKDRLVQQNDIRRLLLPTFLNFLPQDENYVEVFVWNKCFRADFLRQNSITFNEEKKTWEDGLFVTDCLANASQVLMIADILHKSGRGNGEHLSARVFENQIANFILDEKSYKERFEAEFDFKDRHYCRSRFNTLSMLFARVCHTFPNQAVMLIDEAIREPIVVMWSEHVLPRNSMEESLRKYIKQGKSRKIYNLYIDGIMKRITKKLKRIAKRMIGILVP